jgi:HK97 family phage portal protein
MANPFRFFFDRYQREDSPRVSPYDAMTIPAMVFGINKIAGHCGRLPLYIHRKLSGGGSQRATNHWSYNLHTSNANAYQTHDIFRQLVTSHAILWGNGRAAIIDPNGNQPELIPLMPDRTISMLIGGYKFHVTQPEKDDRLNIYESIKKDRQGVIVLPDREVLHIQGIGLDGIEGLSIVSTMRRALGIPIAQEEHAFNQTKKGFSAKVMLEAPQGKFRSEADAKEFIDSFNEQHSTSKNAGKAGLLRDGMKATVMQMSNGDAQFIEQRRFSRQDVMLILGLDGMPGDGDSHSYNSKEMEGLNYLDNALSPWTSRWESQINAKILSESERRREFYSKFDYTELLRTDSKSQAEVFAKLIAARVLNPNECRERIDMNPYPEGNQYINPSITQSGNQDPPEKDTGKQNDTTNTVRESVIKNLIRREARDAINGSNKSNFLTWIENYYANWEPKLANSLEDLGLDRGLATKHCNQSKQQLLTASETTPDRLKASVENCVANWENRYHTLTGE